MTIAVYKFSQLSREEVEAMLGLNLEETRIYQEAKAEGERIGDEQGERRATAKSVLPERRVREPLKPCAFTPGMKNRVPEPALVGRVQRTN